MKRWLGILACALVLEHACAEEGSDEACRMQGKPPAVRLDSMRAPIAAAIDTLDNARVRLSSPSLASGTVTYLSITPSFGDHLEKSCVLGYFVLRRGATSLALPLQVESVTVVKSDRRGDNGEEELSTRVAFRVPEIDEFEGDAPDVPPWKFWDHAQSLNLRVAAFVHVDGVPEGVHFGRDIPVSISNKGANIVTALLFAASFYVAAGMAVVPVERLQGRKRRRWPDRARRLLPWNITGCNAQASLSQLQMLLFTLIVATLLFYHWLRTGLLEELSTDLLYLIGISTAGTAATQVALAIRKNLDADIYQYVQQLGWFTAPMVEAQGTGQASGLLMTDRRFDIYKFQMLIFTFIIAAYVVVNGANRLGSIHISATLLTLMGMSQGAYVGGRAAADLVSPLQDQLRGMQILQQRYMASADPVIRSELRRQFQPAAARAAAMFETMFGRVLPAYMLDMPVDADTLPAVVTGSSGSSSPVPSSE